MLQKFQSQVYTHLKIQTSIVGNRACIFIARTSAMTSDPFHKFLDVSAMVFFKLVIHIDLLLDLSQTCLLAYSKISDV